MNREARVVVMERLVHENRPPSIGLIIPDVTALCLWVEDGDPYASVVSDVMAALCCSLLGTRVKSRF